jgi:dTDP-4-amino-4,6-dideoxygalactose transaminase
MAKTRTSAHHLVSVPLLDLHRQYEQIREEVLRAIERVCSAQQFVLGPEVDALEREIAGFVGAADAVACGSGTDALWISLLAAGIGPGAAVITTPFSFFASVSAIARVGARPVLIDVDPRTLNLDPAKVALKLRQRDQKFSAILPVHLYGQCADMDSFQQLAAEFKLIMIEDAAQAIGAEWKQHRAGSIGHAAAFSFYPTKNLSAYGEAGLVTTQDPDWAQHMRRLRNHGSPRRYWHEELGWNCRMDAIQAAVLRVKLPHLEAWNRQRRERAANYHSCLIQAGLLSGKKRSPVQPLENSPDGYHIFHQYVIRAERRDQLRDFLQQRKIGTEVYYPVPLHLQPSLEYLGYREGDLPEAERAAKEVLALPMFPELSDEEQRWVVESIAEFYS